MCNSLCNKYDVTSFRRVKKKKMTSSPLQDQELPENSILDNSSFWFNSPVKPIYNEFNSVLSTTNQLQFTFEPIQQQQQQDLVFEPMLPDHLTQDNNLIINEDLLEKELETLSKTNEIFEKVNDNMDQASENLQVRCF